MKVNLTLTTLNLWGVQKKGNTRQAHSINFSGKAGNEICSEETGALSEALKVNTTLATLNLEGAYSFRKAQLEHNTNFNGKAVNKIGAEGARALSEALKVNTTLTTLQLSCVQQKQGNIKQEHDININEKQTTRSARKEHVH